MRANTCMKGLKGAILGEQECISFYFLAQNESNKKGEEIKT